ncbi:metastasis suppressor protein 1-like isoform X3 [Notothenia coriiceps]|uniref:Metastasis suppressor protein 1-like isoform X3 n=1 Tax=Notothenia coriiceps TaxID=8208 RepID=A0A6I9MIZ7_9TELE|nr:PREDICTED: metastasis suppressor protein 1-like isoform X3 [Notothenia coriiceps]
MLICVVALTGSASVTACCFLVCRVNCFPPCLSPIPGLHRPPFYSFFSLSYPTFLLQSMSLGALDSLYTACHCQMSASSGPSLIHHSFPFHSSLNSVNSSDSRGSSGSHSHSPSSSSSSSSSNHLFHHHHPRHRYRSSTLPQQAPARLSSISSHDSGFISSSHDQYTTSKSSSPMAAETKDWAKPGPYDQPMVNTLRRKKDKGTPTIVDSNGSLSNNSSLALTSTSAPPLAALQTSVSMEEKNRTVAAQFKAGELEAHEELALALARGLELDTQRSSRDSIQCSSGYSTQTNTPCCSEDTIPSQVSDYDYFSMAGDQEPEQHSDFDKSSTIPRNSDISQSYRLMFQSKRPASTAGLPSTHTAYHGQGSYPQGPYPPTPIHTGAYPATPIGSSSGQGFYSGSSSHNASGSYSTDRGPVIVTPGTATIRRTPSSKPSSRRSGSVTGTGPIPIRTPVIPVQIPTVPDLPGAVNGGRASEERGGGKGEVSPDSPTFAGVEGAGTLPVMSWSGQATTNPPTAPLAQLLQQQGGGGGGGGGGEEEEEQSEGNMLMAIRKGVKLKRTLTSDRSAPRIA